MTTKVCTKCGIEKDLSEFHGNKKTKDGKVFRCKSCVREGTLARVQREIESGVTHKVCPECKIEKSLDEFHNSKYGSYGRGRKCKTCACAEVNERARPQKERNLRKRQEKWQKVIEEQAKTCSKCGVYKPLEEYTISSRTGDGRYESCKACRKKYRDDNKEHVKALKTALYLADKDRIDARKKKYWIDNREVLMANHRQWLKDNIEHVKRYEKQYYADNKEKVAARHKKYTAENQEKVVAARKHNSENCTDPYVRSLCTKRTELTAEDIPDWFIEFKRAEILLKRTIKEQQEKTNASA